MLTDTKTILPEYMALGKSLIKQYTSKEITLEEFENECAYMAWAMGIDELQFEPYPPPPLEVIEYKNLKRDKKQQVQDSFWRLPVVEQYLREYKKVSGKNNGNKWWLGELRSRFHRVGDAKRVSACDTLLNMYPTMQGGSNWFGGRDYV